MTSVADELDNDFVDASVMEHTVCRWNTYGSEACLESMDRKRRMEEGHSAFDALQCRGIEYVERVCRSRATWDVDRPLMFRVQLGELRWTTDEMERAEVEIDGETLGCSSNAKDRSILVSCNG